MHELAIADAVLGIALEQARGRRVIAVEVHAGHLRQVVPGALTFAFELVSQGTVAEGARLDLIEIPAAGTCRDCGHEGELGPAFPLHCHECGGFDVELTAGDELLVDSLEIEEEEELAAPTGGASP